MLVDNLIISQIDEILFKGLFFLSNIKYPNIITSELYDLFFKFIPLFLLKKNGIIYITTGKNLQIIKKLINRLRYDENNKNINNEKNRNLEFNIKSIKIVIHFLYNLTRMINIYDIKSIQGHKVLMRLEESILKHLKYFLLDLKNENKELEFKHQLKEVLEIFSNLYPQYTFDEYEKIKMDIIELFTNKQFNLLKIDLFQNLFDKNIIFNENKDFIKKRNIEIAYYFQFFEIISKNSYFIYNKEEYKLKFLNSIKEFLDMKALEKIFLESSDLMSFAQKTILLKFIRTFHFLDFLDNTNYLKKMKPFSNNDYKKMIIDNNNNINNESIAKYLRSRHKKKK